MHSYKVSVKGEHCAITMKQNYALILIVIQHQVILTCRVNQEDSGKGSPRPLHVRPVKFSCFKVFLLIILASRAYKHTRG